MTKRESLTFMQCFTIGNSRCAGKETFKGMDFEKAKKIINERRDEIESAEMGLMEDWECTSGTVFLDGKFVEGNCRIFLESLWATPLLVLNFNDGNVQEIELFVEYNKNDREHPSHASLPDDWC